MSKLLYRGSQRKHNWACGMCSINNNSHASLSARIEVGVFEEPNKTWHQGRVLEFHSSTFGCGVGGRKQRCLKIHRNRSAHCTDRAFSIATMWFCVVSFCGAVESENDVGGVIGVGTADTKLKSFNGGCSASASRCWVPRCLCESLCNVVAATSVSKRSTIWESVAAAELWEARQRLRGWPLCRISLVTRAVVWVSPVSQCARALAVLCRNSVNSNSFQWCDSSLACCWCVWASACELTKHCVWSISGKILVTSYAAICL